MRIRLYQRPKKTGWLGWIDGRKGEAIGYIRLDGSVLWAWELGCTGA